MSRSPTDPAADTMRGSEPTLEESGPVAATQRAEEPEAQPAGTQAGSRSGDSAQVEGPCLTEDELLDYQAGHCSVRLLARVDAHVDTCPDCRELIYHLLHDGGAPSTETAPVIWPVTFARDSVVGGRYRIRRFVGRGGMGEVYEALDTLMGSRVALKTLLCTASDRPHAVRKLMEEVRNALRVGHPNVCRINELQEHQDPEQRGPPLPFFTMEFIDGARLGTLLRQGPLPLRDVRQIALQVLDGLKAAHARGVLHLDFKSDNVMLRNNSGAPDAVIMDFGLSRALDPVVRQQSSERLHLAGTLPYMSLEQLECRPGLGPAADVYSFGVVLYEMLTGQLPHRADSLSAMLLKHLEGRRPAAPSRQLPRLSPELDRFVLRCLDIDAKKRFPDADSALRALSNLGEWDVAASARLKPWHLLALSGAVAAAVLMAVPGVRGNASSPAPLHDAPAARTAQLQPLPVLPAAPVAPGPPAPEPLQPAKGAGEPLGGAQAPAVSAALLRAPARPRTQQAKSSAAAPPQFAPNVAASTPATAADSTPTRAFPRTEDDWGKSGLPTSLLLPKAAALAPDAGH